MKFKIKFSILILLTITALFFGGTRAYCLDYDDYVVDYMVNDPACQLQVTEWNAWYRANDTVTFGDSFLSAYTDSAPRIREAGFQYDLEVTHVEDSTVDVVAYQVNVIVYSAFDEYLDTFGIFHGAVLTPNKSMRRSNTAIFNGDNSFLTFFIWIDKVRDANGNIYFADLDNIKSVIDDTMDTDIPIEYLETGNIVEINQQERFRERVYVDVYGDD